VVLLVVIALAAIVGMFVLVSWRQCRYDFSTCPMP